MPFVNSGKYDADGVYGLLKEQVHLRANELRGTAGLAKPFAALERVSEHCGTAIVITDSISIRILTDHFFVGDLTGNNPGAVFETGVALAFRLRGEQRAAVCVFGDGATSKGDVAEAMNMAGVWKAPIVFVVNNNGWAISVMLMPSLRFR